jgi:RNA polymerase sigma-70 factor (ECF subfamily)
MRGAVFEDLVDRQYARVSRIAYLITGDREEALDVAQETFVRAYERWRQVADMENPDGWLTRVAINLATSSRRRATRRRRSTPSPYSVAELVAPEPRVAAAILELAPAQRAVVVCHFYLDLSIERTAELLGKKQGTVRALSSQATSRLRTSLGPDFMEITDEPITP